MPVLWVSLEYERYYSGSILGPLIFGKSERLEHCEVPISVVVWASTVCFNGYLGPSGMCCEYVLGPFLKAEGVLVVILMDIDERVFHAHLRQERTKEHGLGCPQTARTHTPGRTQKVDPP